MLFVQACLCMGKIILPMNLGGILMLDQFLYKGNIDLIEKKNSTILIVIGQRLQTAGHYVSNLGSSSN